MYIKQNNQNKQVQGKAVSRISDRGEFRNQRGGAK